LGKRNPVAVHPGQALQREMMQAGLSTAQLARALNVPVARIAQILNGERDITPDTALRLDRYFGIAAEEWLRLQNLYGLVCADIEAITHDVVPMSGLWIKPDPQPAATVAKPPARETGHGRSTLTVRQARDETN
jgi:addiction module HigA family antidote